MMKRNIVPVPISLLFINYLFEKKIYINDLKTRTYLNKFGISMSSNIEFLKICECLFFLLIIPAKNICPDKGMIEIAVSKIGHLIE